MRKPATPAAFEKAFDLWAERFAALKAAKQASGRTERARLIREARRLQNKAIPAAKTAAVRARRSILTEGRKWFQQHGYGALIADCIDHLQQHGHGVRVRRKSGRSKQLGKSDMQKILTQGLGIKGKAGRPKGR